MKFVGTKFDHYCSSCGRRRRIDRCRVCWGEGTHCRICDGTGYVCEKADGDRYHRWQSSWI